MDPSRSAQQVLVPMVLLLLPIFLLAQNFVKKDKLQCKCNHSLQGSLFICSYLLYSSQQQSLHCIFFWRKNSKFSLFLHYLDTVVRFRELITVQESALMLLQEKTSLGAQQRLEPLMVLLELEIGIIAHAVKSLNILTVPNCTYNCKCFSSTPNNNRSINYNSSIHFDSCIHNHGINYNSSFIFYYNH